MKQIRHEYLVLALALALAGCPSSDDGATGGASDGVSDVGGQNDADVSAPEDVPTVEDTAADEGPTPKDAPDLAEPDEVADGPEVVVPQTTLCFPCHEDADCTGGVCLDYGDEGRFCGLSCGAAAPCPPGFGCQAEQCRSLTSVCACTDEMLGRTTSCGITNTHGTCGGVRECGANGLTACEGPTPANDLCDGKDNDCDGDTDTIPCDDGVICTLDTCDGAAGCSYDIQSTAPCNDGDSCTADEGACDTAGVCVAEAFDCDDNNPCTDDSCTPGLGCSSVSSGACTCESDEDCEPPEDRCLGVSKCVTTEAQPWFHCEVDPSTAVVCENPPDATICLAVECEPATGDCIKLSQKEGEVCADPMSLCGLPSTCKGGECVAGAKKKCSDGNACTQDLCVADVGCLNPPIALNACTDDSICTLDLGCDTKDGCKFFDLTPDCDDGEECTADTCDAVVGCQHAPLIQDCCDFGVSDAGFCLPELTVDAGEDVIIEPGDSVTLTAVAEGGDGEYEWQWTTINGPVGKAPAITVTPEQSLTYTVMVIDGAGNSATDKVTVQVKGVPLTMCDWEVVLFDPPNHTQPLANWVFDEACTQATQEVNAKPSALISPLDLESGTLTGAFHVDTTDDDDLIGFVFGWQSPEDFFLMD